MILPGATTSTSDRYWSILHIDT